MGYVSIAFANDYVAPKLLDDGENKLKVLKAAFGQSQASGNDMITLLFTSATKKNIKPFNVYLTFPTGEDEDNDNLFQGRMNDFCAAFKCEVTEKLEVSDVDGEIKSWKGKEGWGFVVTDQSDPAYDPKNVVKRFIVQAA